MHSVTKLIGKAVRILYEAICGGGNLREIECDLLNGGPHSEIYGQDESEDSNKPCSVAALAAEHMDVANTPLQSLRINSLKQTSTNSSSAFTSLRVHQLRSKLQSLGLSERGRRSVLLYRLSNALQEQRAAARHLDDQSLNAAPSSNSTKNGSADQKETPCSVLTVSGVGEFGDYRVLWASLEEDDSYRHLRRLEKSLFQLLQREFPSAVDCHERAIFTPHITLLKKTKNEGDSVTSQVEFPPHNALHNLSMEVPYENLSSSSYNQVLGNSFGSQELTKLCLFKMEASTGGYVAEATFELVDKTSHTPLQRSAAGVDAVEDKLSSAQTSSKQPECTHVPPTSNSTLSSDNASAARRRRADRRKEGRLQHTPRTTAKASFGGIGRCSNLTASLSRKQLS